MTDKLIEQLKEGAVIRPKRWSGDTHYDLGGYVDEEATDLLMEKAAHHIEADAAVIKAAEELAEVLDNVTGKTWAATVDMEDACKVDAALAAFRQAQQARAAIEEKNDEIPK